MDLPLPTSGTMRLAQTPSSGAILGFHTSTPTLASVLQPRVAWLLTSVPLPVASSTPTLLLSSHQVERVEPVVPLVTLTGSGTTGLFLQ